MIPMLLMPALISFPAQAPALPAKRHDAELVLDDWHLAAAQADEARYFGHFAENAVFLGTDATERWTKAEFRVWASPYFKGGRA